MFIRALCKLQRLLDKTRVGAFIAPLALRLYLAPVLWMAGTTKLLHLESTSNWFGNPDWGLGLPFPTFLAALTGGVETIGAICLLAGFAVRWISFPLIAVMVVAGITVHIENGWLAIADTSSIAAQRLQGLLSWLEQTHPGRHDYITELGTPVILNNGIEFAATYSIILLTLFFIGAGKYISLDYWIRRRFYPASSFN